MKKKNNNWWKVHVVMATVTFIVTFSLIVSYNLTINELKAEIRAEPADEITNNEVINNVLLINRLEKSMIEEKIADSTEYLLRVLDETYGGAHKYYYATNDSFEERLHTIYTSSLVYTLLKIYDYNNDERLLTYIDDAVEFILSMQNLHTADKSYGAFHYSFYTDSGNKEDKFVVGTSSKTIYTLIEIYNRTQNEEVLNSAVLAADWLLTMQKEDGSMTPYIKKLNGEWKDTGKESHLYNGQVLSAFSRMYKMTGDKKYLNGAEEIADRTLEKVEMEGCYVGDDYRDPNPVSSSWVILSLYDYYLALDAIDDDSYEGKYGKNFVKKTVLGCSFDILDRQIDDPTNLQVHGRWDGSFSTSGNGWMNEVLSDVYFFCKDQDGGESCDKFKDAMIGVTRWLTQFTYGELNSVGLPNPEMANGGLFWNREDKYIRTDSVCHGVNALVNMIDEYEDGVLLKI